MRTTSPVRLEHRSSNWVVRLLLLSVAIEWLVAAGATAAAIYLHVQNARWAGALWRDEAHSAAAAIRPSLGDVWHGLATDNFPLLHTLLLRAWGLMEWGRTDGGMRALGAAIGVAILVVLWFNAWRINRAPPTIALALWGFNVVAIRYGDSVRPYGLGILLQLLSAYAMGRLAMAPSWRRIAATSLLCTLAVQCLYQNALFVLAFGLAGYAVVLRGREYQRLAPVLAAGMVAALSLLPYVVPIRQSNDWATVMESPVSVEQSKTNFEILLGGGHPAVLGGVLLIAAASCITSFSQQFPKRVRADRPASDWSLYAILAGLLGSAGIFALLYSVSFQPLPWHFLPVLAMLSFACDTIFGRPSWASPIRAAALLAIACLSWNSIVETLTVRQTNVDRIAKYLEKHAKPEDLIVVDQWFVGVTFSRYYHGEAPWTTLPELGEIRVHRYDLVKLAMSTPNAIEPVMRRTAATLLSGNRVWIVGKLPQLPRGYAARPLPPAPQSEYGWQSMYYVLSWQLEASTVIYRLAERQSTVSLSPSQATFPEDVGLEVFHRWKVR